MSGESENAWNAPPLSDRQTLLARAAELSSVDFLSADESEEAQGVLEKLRAEVVRVDGENVALVTRRDELLALVARVSQEVPLPDEVANALAQRGALLAEVGTLRAHIVDVEAERDEWHAAAESVAARWKSTADTLAHQRDDARQAHADAQAMLEEVAAERDELDDGANLLERVRGLCAENDRLRTMIANYDHNHGARCDAENERYATIAESACQMLGRVRDSLHCTMAANGAEALRIEATGSEIETFLSDPSHDVPGLRARVAARDRALDACANRIGELVGQVAAEQDVALQQTSAIVLMVETLQDVRYELRRVGSLPEASAVLVPLTALVMRVDAAIGRPRFGFQARVLAAIDGGHDDDEGVS